MNHGYVADALVRISVMQASIKNYGFVQYLIEMIDGARNNNKLNEQEKYFLPLVTGFYEYLSEHSSEY